MKNDQADLEQKKQGLLKRLISLKEKYLKEEKARKYEPEIANLQSEIKLIDDLIRAGQIEKEKARSEERVRRGWAIIEEHKKAHHLDGQMHIEFNKLLVEDEQDALKRRVQISSKHFVMMTREQEESHFAGFEQSDEDEKVGPFAIGKKVKPIFKKQKRIVEMLVPAVPSTIENAKEAGWVLKEGEVIEPEELDGENSILQRCIPQAEVFYLDL